LLTGERPFAAEHLAAQARQHIEENPPRASRRNRELPRAVDAVLARGMAKKPEQRWSTAGAFADALEEALTGTGSTRTFPAQAARVGTRGRMRTQRPPAIASLSPTAPASAAAHGPAPPPIFTSVSEPAAGRPKRAAAIAALAAAALAIGVVAGASDHGGTAPPARIARHAAPAQLPKVVVHPVPQHHKPAPPSEAASTTSVAATPRTPDTLEARGHQLMVNGAYTEAIPVLRQAVNAASPADLTYAYALYDLGRSLRLAGDPQAAIPLLEQRLQIPDQTGVVLSELQLARRQAGLATPGSASAQTGAPQDGGAGPLPTGKPAHNPKHHGTQHATDFSAQIQTG
jgi:serine/threonine-protein kinase